MEATLPLPPCNSSRMALPSGFGNAPQQQGRDTRLKQGVADELVVLALVLDTVKLTGVVGKYAVEVVE